MDTNQIVNSGFYYWNSHGDTETQQINFGLNKKKVNKHFSINAIGDVQVGNSQELDYASRSLWPELLQADSSSFNIFLGDLVNKTPDEIVDYLMKRAEDIYAEKEKQLYDESQMLEFEKVVILRVVDSLWTDHIDEMDQLRQSIGLRGYGQLNPLVEYQQDGFRMFEQMVGAIEYDVTRLFLKAEIRQDIKR